MMDSNEYDGFNSKLTRAEQKGWVGFIEVCHSFLGNTKADIYQTIIQELPSAYKALPRNMSLKIHFLTRQLCFFPENLGAV